MWSCHFAEYTPRLTWRALFWSSILSRRASSSLLSHSRGYKVMWDATNALPRHWRHIIRWKATRGCAAHYLGRHSLAPTIGITLEPELTTNSTPTYQPYLMLFPVVELDLALEPDESESQSSTELSSYPWILSNHLCIQLPTFHPCLHTPISRPSLASPLAEEWHTLTRLLTPLPWDESWAPTFLVVSLPGGINGNILYHIFFG